MQKCVNAEGDYFEGDNVTDNWFCKYNDLLDQSRFFFCECHTSYTHNIPPKNFLALLLYIQ